MRVFPYRFILVWHCGRRGGARAAARRAAKDPAAILAAARQALGGEKKLAAVKSFTATGRTRQVRGDNLVPIEFEIFVELPDKYLRKDEIPAQESGPTATGLQRRGVAAGSAAAGAARRARTPPGGARRRIPRACSDAGAPTAPRASRR